MISLKLVLFCFILMLAGCSSLGLVADVVGAVAGGTNSGTQVDVDSEIVFGDSDKSTAVQLGSNSSQTATVINNITSVPAYVIVLLVLGWIMPTPADILAGIGNLFRRKKRGR